MHYRRVLRINRAEEPHRAFTLYDGTVRHAFRFVVWSVFFHRGLIAANFIKNTIASA